VEMEFGTLVKEVRYFKDSPIYAMTKIQEALFVTGADSRIISILNI